MRPKLIQQQGMTLVEVLIAMVLLGFVTLGSVSVLSATLNQNKLAQQRSLATNLAAERIELLTSERFRSAAAFATYAEPGEVAAAGPPGTLTADYGSIPGYPNFRRVLTLEYDTPYAGMLKVTSEVIWQDLKQGEKRHTLITLVHPGLEQGS